MSYMANKPIYYKPYAANNNCTYTQMGAYNPGVRGAVMGYYVVPNYSPPGYDTLTHGPPGGCEESSNGYFQIGKAYGSGANNCQTTYSASMCM